MSTNNVAQPGPAPPPPFVPGAPVMGSSITTAPATAVLDEVNLFSGQATQEPIAFCGACALPGDFNGDRTGSAADYVVWRKNSGTQNGYDTWRGNFGESGPVPINVTTLGTFPNDAIKIQFFLNNPAINELYFPPGTYLFDRPVFVPSNKTLRGDAIGVSRIETLVDTAVFRIDINVTNATISNFVIERPQTQDSNNEIIRTDKADNVCISNIRVINSASRAPIIGVVGGNNVTVRDSVIVNYHTVRFEPSVQVPGGIPQIFGSGITFFNSANTTVSNNQVTQEFIPDAGPSPYKGYYQASAFVLSNTVGGSVMGNYAYLSRQGIDTSGSSFLEISDVQSGCRHDPRISSDSSPAYRRIQ